jgi:tetratricopeptide (TPR) repeat protein
MDALLWVYLEEERYQDVVILAGKLLKRYPNNQRFKWALADALFGMENYDKAEELYRYILDVSDSRPFNTFVNSLKMRVALARIYMKRKLYYKAIAECRRARYYKIAPVYKDDVKHELKEAGDMLKEARKHK